MAIFFIIFNIFVGLFFVYSAQLKLFPVEFFELKIAETVPVGEVLSGLLARGIIGFEFFLGFALIIHLILTRRVLKIIIWTLAVFSVINLVELIRFGNESSCGCMGVHTELSPLVSLIKNLLLIGLFIIELKMYKDIRSVKYKIFQFVPALLLLALPFILNPIDLNPPPITGAMGGKKLNLEVLDTHPKVKGKTFNDDLKQGKKIIAFLSLTCNYCKVAATRLAQIKKQHPELPLYFIMNGDSVDMAPFYRTTHAQDVPALHFNGGEDFLELGGYDLPAIYWVNDAYVYRRDSYYSFNYQEFDAWMKGKEVKK